VNVGIVGTGGMGKALARCAAAAGHRAFLGSRDPEKGARIAAPLGKGVAGGSIAEAAEVGALIILAVPWAGVPDALASARTGLAGKVLIDCTNPMIDARKPLLVGCTTSGAEEIAALASQARVTKAFNAIAARLLASCDPRFGEHAATIFHCGDDEDAQRATAGLITDIGLRALDVGPLCVARYLEPLAALSLYVENAIGHDADVVLAPLVRPRRRR
jgi:predicted dinucleotide-binding enzyme